MSAELKVFRQRPNEAVIEELKNLLTDAETGNITGLVAVHQTNNDSLRWSQAGIKDRFQTMGYIEWVKMKLAMAPDAEEDEA